MSRHVHYVDLNKPTMMHIYIVLTFAAVANCGFGAMCIMFAIEGCGTKQRQR